MSAMGERVEGMLWQSAGLSKRRVLLKRAKNRLVVKRD
jgi:hypothetical protein